MSLRTGVVVVALLCFTATSQAQAPTAVVNGQVRDTSGAAIPNATVEIVNDATRVHYTTETNSEGIYSVPNLPPGTYHIQVSKTGFKTIIHPDVVLHVQDADAIGFTLPVGPMSDTVTVEGGASLVDTESAAVSTVVDRQFAENIPMNGRSFQTLIELTPGVVIVPSNPGDSGQFSVNGQRASSNYWMVDGVSANIGVGATTSPGNGFGGTLGSFSATGGTNSLVSVDALQEFRIQTSTYAPEFGRTPGAQISILTRSGTNQFHGTAFDYLRNSIFDANDWFADFTGLSKPQERQNDFGGTFGGPILKNKTFFFFSYEGLRLRLPLVALTTVPDASFTPGGTTNSRQNATPAMQPFLNSFPLPNPNSPEIFLRGNPTGSAHFNASFSNPATLDAYSIRIDHKLSDKFSVFGRYNYSPSEVRDRGGAAGQWALSVVEPDHITTQTATVGATWVISPTVTNDLRFNYSRTNGESRDFLDNFGGAVPLTSLPFPTGFTAQNAKFFLFISSLRPSFGLIAGRNAQNLQRQINVVENLSSQKGSHSLKFGVDFRRLSPLTRPPSYVQQPQFLNVPSAQAGKPFSGRIFSSAETTLLFRNLGVFAQDTWRVARRLTVTYGVRWDVDFVPSSLNGPSIPAVTGYNPIDLSQLAIAPAGTPPFKTTYGNVAPRLGVAYQLSQDQAWGTALRGGFGVFYDLVSSEDGAILTLSSPPFGASNFLRGGTFPYNPAPAPPSITPSGSISQLYAFNPNLELPYSLEWNIALEQSLGRQQALSASYIGASGRRLLQTAFFQFPVATNPNINFADFIDNTASSRYDALQVQFQRRLSHGLQVLASYTWAHSIDDGSAGSPELSSNQAVPGSSSNASRGPSDFDIRNSFSAGMTYDIPVLKSTAFANAILRGWSVQNFIYARSAPPGDVSDGNFSNFNSGIQADIRPDLVVGQPLYLYGSQCIAALGPPCAGGKGFNPAAFTDPPTDPNTGNPLRQGNVPRNFLRGFGATQWDFAVHRDFAIRESLKLQFRAEMFNILNHPNFGQPNGDISGVQFGQSTTMLGRSLNQLNSGGGAFSPLYQIGGPRSIQLALKLMF